MFCLLKNIENVIPEEYYFCTNSELNTIIAHEDDEDDDDEVFIIMNFLFYVYLLKSAFTDKIKNPLILIL